MDEKRHDEMMMNIMKELEQDDLNLSDAITLWHSLGLFLFSNIDKENKDVSKIYEQMKNYLSDMDNMKKASK